MSIATEISRIKDAKDAIRASIIAKGVNVPQAAKLDTYADRIDEIVQTASGNMEVVTSSPSGTINAADNKFYMLSGDAGALVFNLPAMQQGGHGIYLLMTTASTSVVSFTSEGSVTINFPTGFQVEADKCYLMDFEFAQSEWQVSVEEWFVNGGGGTDWESIYASLLSGTGPTELSSSTVPSSVTSIRQNVFRQETGLLSVNTPSITNVGQNAFNQCTNLTTVELGASSIINDYAFNQCTNLTTVKTSDGYIVPKTSAFGNCTKLVSIPKKIILNDGQYQFSGCTLLTGDVTISCTNTSASSSTAIGNSAFQNTKLKNVVFDNSWNNVSASIGGWMFRDCTDIKSITFPDAININSAGTSYNTQGFCSSTLRSFTLPTQKSTMLPHYFFNGFRICGIVTIPQNFTTINESSISAYSSIYKFVSETPATVNGSATITSLWAAPILVPDNAVDAYKAASRWSAASYAIKPFSWTGPETGYKAELWRSSGNVIYPISSSESTVITSADTGLTYIRYAVIGSEATGIDANAFKNNTALYHLDMRFATGLTSIGTSAFEGCSSLFNIVGLENATSLTTIGDNAFASTKVHYITIPASVISIGASAFKNTELVEFDFATNSNCTSIGDSAFEGCSLLETIKFSDELTTVGSSSVFKGCSRIAEFDFSNTKITTLRGQTGNISNFYGCNAFKTLKLPATFTRCPWGTEYVSPIYNCSSVSELWLYSAVVPEWGSTQGNMFKGTKLETKDPEQASIYVLPELVDAYKAASGWRGYAAIIKPIPTE